MNIEELQREFREWRSLQRRTAWKPIVDSTGTSSQSWFGGKPTFSRNREWPVCSECKKPMKFFLQLDLSALPRDFETPLKTGLLQLFYCSSDDGMCETWQAFSGTQEVWISDSNDNGGLPPDCIEPLEKSIIVDWIKSDDFPHPEDHESLCVTYDYDFPKNVVTVRCSDPPIELKNLDINSGVAEGIANSTTGDKLGGWPHWIQGAEYPNCPQCDTEMRLLFQVDSEDNLPYMFGDVGCAHLTQCPNHPNVLAFGWACS